MPKYRICCSWKKENFKLSQRSVIVKLPLNYLKGAQKMNFIWNEIIIVVLLWRWLWMSEINERIFKLRTSCIEERLSVTVSLFSITLFLLLLSSYQSRALDHTKCLSQFLMKKKKNVFCWFHWTEVYEMVLWI